MTNIVIIQGNLTRDPEIKQMPSGANIAELQVAVNRKYRTNDGEQREEVAYIKVMFSFCSIIKPQS